MERGLTKINSPLFWLGLHEILTKNGLLSRALIEPCQLS